jgi:uncharacterized protein (TIGR00266 family)
LTKEDNMKVDIRYKPSYSLGFLNLDGGEEVRVEGGSMVSMSHGVIIETEATGGLLSSISRKMFGGESFFQNTFQAPSEGGEITVAPALPGDLLNVNLNGPLMVQSGSYVASEMDIDLDTKWSGAKTFFASEGMIMLRASGRGQMLVSSYGAIHDMELASGQRYTVDSGHLVAFTAGIDFRVRKVGGIKSTLFSGEGLVVDLAGPGRVLLQSRSTDQFLAWLIPQLPRPDSGD